MSKYLVYAVVIISFIVGIGVGYIITPEYSQESQKKNNMSLDLGRPDANLDKRYIDGMIAHHLAAIYLAKQAQDISTRNEIKELSRAIIAADEKGIRQLYVWKKEWYNNTKEITKYQKVNLGTSDEKFDLRFLNALIIHHDDAITIARDVQQKSTRNEILTLASEVIQSLSESKITLQTWRKTWYGI
jgi:uncharacterized protein (DUF305 family)